jgi:hypothetical protein
MLFGERPRRVLLARRRRESLPHTPYLSSTETNTTGSHTILTQKNIIKIVFGVITHLISLCPPPCDNPPPNTGPPSRLLRQRRPITPRVQRLLPTQRQRKKRWAGVAGALGAVGAARASSGGGAVRGPVPLGGRRRPLGVAGAANQPREHQTAPFLSLDSSSSFSLLLMSTL